MRRNQNQLTIFETARASLVKTKKLMFFASALLQTKCVEDETCDTAWTDMTVIGYNPKFIESLKLAVAKFVIIHELMHILLKHGLRRGSRDSKRWNHACDYAINILLKDLGFEVWEFALVDDRFRGMSAEQIYILLDQEERQRGKKGKGNNQGGLDGDLRPVPGITPEQLDKINHEIGKVLARAAAMAREHGVMPGELEAIVGASYQDPIPWEQVLIDYMTACVAQDENWSRRNRRYSEAILPSHHASGMDELTVVADSSGSMFTKKVFERVAVAINHIVQVIKPMVVRVVWADDTEMSNIDVFEDGAEVVLHPKGGGGTDMRKSLRYVSKFNPEVVLLLTDGYTPWDEVPYPYPVIVGCTTNAPVPDWARVVRVEVQ